MSSYTNLRKACRVDLYKRCEDELDQRRQKQESQIYYNFSLQELYPVESPRKSMKIKEALIEKLSQKDIRTLKIGAVCVAVILVFVFASELIAHWTQARKSLAQLENKLELLDVDKAKQAGLMSIVPVFKMPEKEEMQKFLFRDKLDEQLKKAGINSKPLQVVSTGKSKQTAYKLLRLKCNATCRFEQLLDLLANLKENPYLVGVEEMRIKCDPKKPQEVELDLTVSTFVR